MAKNVWTLVQGKLLKCQAQAPDLFVLVHRLMDKLTKKEMEHWAITSWAIWNTRNKFYFEDTQLRSKAILRGATSLLDDYQMLMANQRNL